MGFLYIGIAHWGHDTLQEAKQRIFLNSPACLMEEKKKKNPQCTFLDAVESISKEIPCLEKTS